LYLTGIGNISPMRLIIQVEFAGLRRFSAKTGSVFAGLAGPVQKNRADWLQNTAKSGISR
jgi:hypothetical protein